VSTQPGWVADNCSVNLFEDEWCPSQRYLKVLRLGKPRKEPWLELDWYKGGRM
jgi:hypothetical protein